MAILLNNFKYFYLGIKYLMMMMESKFQGVIGGLRHYESQFFFNKPACRRQKKTGSIGHRGQHGLQRTILENRFIKKQILFRTNYLEKIDKILFRDRGWELTYTGKGNISPAHKRVKNYSVYPETRIVGSKVWGTHVFSYPLA